MTRRALGMISAFAVLAVLIYNLWAYCCGRCAAENFVQLGPFGLVLTGVTVLAGGILLALKATRIRRLLRSRCQCGAFPVSGWVFCPRCGTNLKGSSDSSPSA